MLDFPSAPVVGELFPAAPIAGQPVYRWDGVKWGPKHVVVGAQPSDSAPPMDGVAASGSLSPYARGDHVHPFDTRYAPSDNPAFTGTLTAENFSVQYDLTLTGKVIATAKGHKIGSASGNLWSDPLVPDDANIVLHNAGSEDWGGIGVDAAGTFWVRTGFDTRVAAAMTAKNNVGFTGVVTAPTPPVSNDTQVATTAYVNANQALGGPYLPLTGGTVTGTFNVSADIYLYGWGGSAAAALLYFGKTAGVYFHYSTNGNYYFTGGAVYTANGRSWGDGDFTRPVSNGRVGPHAGDYFQVGGTGLAEPYGGASVTGTSGYMISYNSQAGNMTRYRYSQIFVIDTWYTAGYV